MKNKKRPTVTHSVFELAEALSLTPADAVEIEVRSVLNDKVIGMVKKHHLTHA